MTATQHIRTELEALENKLSKARTRVGEGETVDLTPMEDAVQTICNAINQRSNEDQQLLKPPLLSVLEELDHLTSAIRERLDELSAQLGDTSERRRALTAYARSS